MGRRLVVALVAGAAFSALPGRGYGQAPPQPTGPAGAGRPVQPVAPQMQPAPQAQPAKPFREQWRQMPAEDRQRFKSNVERWLALPPEERSALREREGIRRERLQREADAAMRDMGLQLEAEKRAQFEQRYLEERRRIDRALREELREKRRRELAPVVERLKKEFSEGQRSNPAGSGSAAPSSPRK